MKVFLEFMLKNVSSEFNLAIDALFKVKSFQKNVKSRRLRNAVVVDMKKIIEY